MLTTVLWLARGQPHREHAAPPKLALDGNATALRVDEALRDVEPKTKARLTLPRALRLVEAVE